MTHFNTYNAASKNFNIGGRQNGHTDGRTDGRTDGQTDRNRYYIGSLLLRSSPKRRDKFIHIFSVMQPLHANEQILI